MILTASAFVRLLTFSKNAQRPHSRGKRTKATRAAEVSS
jgi:hypothetical protein